MITVVIKHDGEDKVTKMTYNNVWREIKDIPEATIIVSNHWFDDLSSVKTEFVCFVEADCLVTSGYFNSQLGLMKKNKQFRMMAVMSSCTSVVTWANKIYGYRVGGRYSDGVIPNKEKKSTSPYPVQIAYLPGALIRVSTLRKLLTSLHPVNGWENDLIFFSTILSLGFWGNGVGNGIGSSVFINPNASYCTTEDYVNSIANFDIEPSDTVLNMFKHQVI